MSESLASFRELRGIGPAAEARLHHAGIHTWAALAEVLAVLGRVRRRANGGGDPVTELADQVAAMVAEEPSAPAPGHAPERGDAPERGHAPEPDAVAVRAVRDHRVVLDAGKAIGGRARDLTLDVSTAPLLGVEEFEFEATLAARVLASGSADATSVGSGWVTVGTRHGVGHPPAVLPLHFDGVTLSSGVQRLRLELAVRLPDGGPAPALVLAG